MKSAALRDILRRLEAAALAAGVIWTVAVTAGSDFHGQNKPTIPLGMQVDEEQAFLAPILARLEKVRAAGGTLSVQK